MLQVYNSLAREKQVFEPIEPGKVRMYVCGITVYDYCHVGHARAFVVFDVIARYLRASGYALEYVRNITDIDDKIIQRAEQNGEDFDALTGRFIEAMHEDFAALGIQPPDQEPRATRSMDDIINMVAALVDKGFAYAAANGDVYYDVSRFERYGELGGEQSGDLQPGARVQVDEHKDDPMDFVLWKAAKPDEPSWDSPWGKGRPGWHIECSAMSTCCLGNHFDIHGGGMDLKFPHHENEIAQSEAATGEKFVNYWIHNGFVQVDEEKMSKSLGNFFTVRDVLKVYRPEELRFFILASHYRSPLNYTEDNLLKARAALTRFYTALRETEAGDAQVLPAYRERFHAAMDDDFNTPEAIAVLFDVARDLNKAREQGSDEVPALVATLRGLAGILGILEGDAEEFLKGQAASGGLDDAAIDELVAQRIAAREARDWAEADRIRDVLKEQGVVLEDGAGKTGWRRG